MEIKTLFIRPFADKFNPASLRLLYQEYIHYIGLVAIPVLFSFSPNSQELLFVKVNTRSAVHNIN